MIREQRRKEEALLKQWGVTEQELQEWLKQGDLARDAREAGREAAYADLTDFELCRDLAGTFAGESAKKSGDLIGDVRDRYDTIVIELLAERYTQTDGKRYSLRTVLLRECETDKALKEFLVSLGKWIQRHAWDYLRRCMRGESQYTWNPDDGDDVRAMAALRGHYASESLMIALLAEYERDREGLMQFLSAVFKQWRKILEPRNPWRVRLVTQQCESEGKRKVSHHKIAQYLAKIGAVSKDSGVSTTKEYALLRSRIKQIRSRDQKAALKRRQKKR